MTERRGKYNARRTEVYGITFASGKEAHRYQELMLMQKAGVITNLERQVKYSIDINGVHVCSYFADFQYTNVADGEVVTEDAKGFQTQVYRIKKKLVRALYGVDIKEV